MPLLSYPPGFFETYSAKDVPPDISHKQEEARAYFQENGGNVETMSVWSISGIPNSVACFSCHARQ